MGDDTRSTKPVARRRSESAPPPRRRTNEAITVQKDGTISIKTGTIITIVGGLLGGAGGGTGVMTMLGQPNTELIARMEAIESRQAAIEARQAEQERLTKQSSDLTLIIYKVILRTNPDAAISLEDLHLGPE